MRCLVKTTGWIGDSLFCLPIAEKLKKEQGFTSVDYLIYLPQPYRLICNNSHIDNVFIHGLSKNFNESVYDKIYTTPVLGDRKELGTEIFQKSCGIKNTSKEFHVDTLKDFDYLANIFKESLPDKPVITYQGDWSKRRWFFTKEQFSNGDLDRQGETESIIKALDDSNKFNLIKISDYNAASRSRDVRGCDLDYDRFAFLASLIKISDLYIGAEGGISNLASGVGTKCIITTCHLHKWMKINNYGYVPAGPENFFPNSGHLNANPYTTNEEFVDLIFDFFRIH